MMNGYSSEWERKKKFMKNGKSMLVCIIKYKKSSRVLRACEKRERRKKRRTINKF